MDLTIVPDKVKLIKDLRCGGCGGNADVLVVRQKFFEVRVMCYCTNCYIKATLPDDPKQINKDDFKPKPPDHTSPLAKTIIR